MKAVYHRHGKTYTLLRLLKAEHLMYKDLVA